MKFPVNEKILNSIINSDSHLNVVFGESFSGKTTMLDNLEKVYSEQGKRVCRLTAEDIMSEYFVSTPDDKLFSDWLDEKFCCSILLIDHCEYWDGKEHTATDVGEALARFVKKGDKKAVLSIESKAKKSEEIAHSHLFDRYTDSIEFFCLEEATAETKLYYLTVFTKLHRIELHMDSMLKIVEKFNVSMFNTVVVLLKITMQNGQTEEESLEKICRYYSGEK